MRLKTWLVAALGLGSLLLLIAVSMLASSRKAQDIYTPLDALNEHHYTVDTKLRRLRSDAACRASSSATTCSTSRASAQYRQRLAMFRETNMATVSELRALVGGHEDRFSACKRSSTTTGRRSIRCSTGRRRKRS
jgi:hypothetical protein